LLATEIRAGVTQYLTKKRRMAVGYEVGVIPKGRLRVDVLGMNLKRNVVIVEIKSGVQDFRSDRKWHLYRNFCSQFFFAMDNDTFQKVKASIPPGVGVFVVGERPPRKRNYPIKVVRRAEKKELDNEIVLDMALKLAYKNADATRYKRSTKR